MSRRVVQRTVLYLGELYASQEAGWQRGLEGFDERRHSWITLSLFPEDREISAEAVGGQQLKLQKMELRRPRSFRELLVGMGVAEGAGAGRILAGEDPPYNTGNENWIYDILSRRASDDALLLSADVESPGPEGDHLFA